MRFRTGGLDRNLLPASACLIICVGFFVWASGRGYDVTDESYYLTWDATPYSFHFSISLFGYFWHPIYELVGGNIALLRMAGAAVLIATSAAFALALQKFIALDSTSRSERWLIILGICTSAFWFFAIWLTVPGYDELNLSLLLLFASGLLMAAADATNVRAGFLRQTIGPAILSGASLGVIALVKPTTCAVAVAFAFAWLALLRPQRPFVLFAVSAASAIAVLAISALLIDGSFSAFLHRQLTNFTLSRLMDQPGDMHGIINSVVGPFARDRVWKIFPAIALGAAMFATCLGVVSAALGLMRIDRGLQSAVSYGLVILLGVFVMLARAVDLQANIAWYNYHAWYYTLGILAVAIAVVLARAESVVANPQLWRRACAAVFIAALPLAYSFGTNVSLVRHVEGASVFWAGSAFLICSLATPAKRTLLIGVAALAIGITTVGLLAGVASAPGRPDVALVQDTEPVTVGPDGARLFVDPATADYIKSLQRAAAGAGFQSGTPIVDLAETGPGIAFALSGATVGSPWLGDTPDGSLAFARAVLTSVPKSQLRHAWIITGSERNLARVQTTLRSLGLAFPDTYRTVIVTRMNAFGWRNTLWSPQAN
jgi:hypothetical protein